MSMGWIAAAVAAVIVVYLIVAFNRLVRQRNVVREGWSGIDVQLKRRTDLVPNLVETVKGYATHERSLFEEIASRRAASVAASDVGGQANAERALSGSLGRLMAVAEAYPDLKANQNMLQLSEELTSTENRVAFARQAYNDAVMAYNNKREVFPAGIIAGMTGFAPAALLEVDDPGKREAPRVSF
jgi:LemA protein